MDTGIKRRWFLSGLFLAVWGLLLFPPLPASAQEKAGWQGRWEKVLADAKKEGRVVVDGPPGEFIRNALVLLC